MASADNGSGQTGANGAAPTGGGQVQLAQAVPAADQGASAPSVAMATRPGLTNIGKVASLSGQASATRSDGDEVALAVGAPVYQGDTIKTSADGSIGIVFIDETTFSLGGNASMVLNELIYNSAANTGSSLMSVVKGTFVFVTGKVAATGPDHMKVGTPAGTIGIRGTKVGCSIDVGTSAVTCVNLTKPDGSIGAWAFENLATTVVIDSANQAVIAFDQFSLPFITTLTPEEIDSLFSGITVTQLAPLPLSEGGIAIEPNLEFVFFSSTPLPTPPTNEQLTQLFQQAVQQQSLLLQEDAEVAAITTVTVGESSGGLGEGGGSVEGSQPGAVGITGVTVPEGLESGGDPVVVTLVSPTEVQGTQGEGGPIVFAFILDPVTGEFTFDLLQALDHPVPGATGGGDVIDLVFATTLTDGDGTITIKVEDDGPTVAVNDPVSLDDDALAGGNPGGVDDDVDGANLAGTLGHDFGADGGSIAFLTSGAPAGFTYELSGDDLLVKQDGVTVLTVTLDTATGAYTVSQNAAIDNAAADNENNQAFAVTYRVTDGDGDTADGTLNIDVDDDTPTAVAGPPVGLNEGDVTPVIGTNLLANDTQGADGAEVTSFSYDSGAQTADADGTPVATALGGTLTVSADGTWSYVAPANVTGDSDDSFTYTITDGDGDISEASQAITVNNIGIGDVIVPENLTSGGVPVIIQQVSPTLVQGVLQTTGDTVFTFEIDPVTDEFTFLTELPFDNPGGGGDALDIIFIIIGPGGDPVNITVEIPEGGGNSVSGSALGDVTVVVQDGVPTAVAGPPVIINEGDTATVIGTNLLANDDFGADLPGKGVVSITYNGGSADIAAGGSVTVTTTLGAVLTVNADGSWSYDPPAVVTDTSDDSFTYTIEDFDGDTSTAGQTITIDEDNTATAGDNTLDTLAEANLAEGSAPAAPVTANGTVTIDFGADAAAIAITQISAPVVDDPDDVAAPGALTSLGRSLTFTETDLGGGSRKLTATEDDGNTEVFTLTIDADGGYSFTLLQALDHPDLDETGAADALDLAFTYTAAEDVDSDNGTITIRITDDGPAAVAGTSVDLNEGDVAPVVGTNLLDNDTEGADGAEVTSFTYDSGAKTADANGTPVATALGGTLAVNADGSWSYVAPANVTGDADDSFSYTITDADGDTSTAAQSITIDEDNTAVAGDNTLDTLAEANLAEGSAPAAPVTASGTVTIDFGEDAGSVAITAISAPTVDDPDDVAAPGALTSLGRSLTFTETDLGGGSRKLTATEDDGNTEVFTLTIDADGDYIFTLLQALDHPDLDETAAADALDLAFTYTAAEDVDSDSGTITIRITDDGPAAVAGTSVDLNEGDVAPVVGTNLLDNDTEGADGAEVTSFTYDSGAKTADANGTPVATALGGTLAVNADGSWSYVAPANVTGDADDSFSYTITDADGDTSTAAQSITIDEDNTAVAGDNTLDTLAEANLAEGSAPAAPVTVSGTVTIDFGEDAGAVAITQISAPVVDDPDDVAAPGALTSLGRSLTFTETDLGGGSRKLTATEDDGNTEVFTLTIDADGGYSFTLLQVLDHPDLDETAAADALDLAFTYTAAEDVDSDSGTITIRITDDGPAAVAGTSVDLNEGDVAPVVGTNLLDNDTEGADGAEVTSFTYDSGAKTADANGTPVATALGGTLAVNADGSWSYVAPANVTGDADDSFTYTITDADGDTSTAAQSITIDEDNTAVAGDNELDAVSETNLADGNAPAPPVTASGTVTIDFGVDAGAVGITGITGPGGLTSGGQALVYGLSGDGDARTLTATVDGGATEVFTLTVEADGDYNFALMQPLDHLGGNDAAADLAFTYTAAEDIDSDSGTITIRVTDDGPIAVADTGSTDDIFALDSNIVIMFDRSGSMIVDPNVDGYAQRIDLARAAVASLLAAAETAGDVNVLIIDFSDDAASSGWFTGPDAVDQANTYLNSLVADGFTDYDAAVALAASEFVTLDESLRLAADQNLAYFLSDGIPVDEDDGNHNSIDTAEQDAWETFLNTNDVKALAIGMGAGTDSSAAIAELATVAYDGVAEAQLAPIIVSDENQLIDTMLGTLRLGTTGNVLANDAFGADGAGQIVSVTVDTGIGDDLVTNFVYDPDANGGDGGITNDDLLSPVVGSVLYVTTELDGALTFDFATGDYSYDVSISAGGATETINYTIADADGDTSSADLAIEVNRVAARLTGQITSNAAPSNQVLLLTFVALNDPSKFFQLVIDTSAGGQSESSVILIDEDTGFLVTEEPYMLSLEYISGDNAFQITDLTIGDVDLFGGSATNTNNIAGNIKLGFGENDDQAVTMIFNPLDAAVTVEGPYGQDGAGMTDPFDSDPVIATQRVGTEIGETITGDGLADIISGGDGNDTLNGGGAADYLFGEAGDDTLNGDGGNDLLSGGTGADTLNGGLGSDILVGGADIDTLTGGGDGDTFKYLAAEDGGAAEIITDFNMAQGDVLDISEILEGYDPDTSVLADFVSVESADSGADTLVKIDPNGPTDDAAFVSLVTLDNVVTDVTSLESSLVLV